MDKNPLSQNLEKYQKKKTFQKQFTLAEMQE
jgi:hypothetical protein